MFFDIKTDKNSSVRDFQELGLEDFQSNTSMQAKESEFDRERKKLTPHKQWSSWLDVEPI